MKKIIIFLALVLTVCSAAVADVLTKESEVGTIGMLYGREAMVVDLGGTIGKVAIALENVGATAEDAFGTRFSTTSGATNFYDPETYKLEDGWYVPSQDELTALKSLLQWKSDYSAVCYKNHSDLQFPLRKAGQSYYGDYITSTTNASDTYTDYAYLYISYAYNPGEGFGIPSISMSEGHNQSNLAIRLFHKLPTKNQCLFYTSSDGNVVTPFSADFNVSIVSNTYENGQGVIIFSGELTSIGAFTFNSKSALTSVTIPASVTSIGEYAFNGTNITSVTIPASLTSIETYTFQGCSQLTSLTFAANSQLKTIGDYAFGNSAISGELNNLPASLTSIGDNAFIKTNITSVTFPASLTSIGESAFEGCSKLSSLTFAKGSQLETIGTKAFKSSLEGELTLPASLKSIGDFAFCYSNITAVTIPALVTSIGNYAFNVCKNLKTLTFAANSQLKIIGQSAFNTTAIATVTIPASVTNIGYNAFVKCPLAKVFMSNKNYTGFDKTCFGESAVIFTSLELYEACKEYFYKNKVEVSDLKDWQEYTIDQIEDAIKTVNILSDKDKDIISGYIADIRKASELDAVTKIRDKALAVIDQQKDIEKTLQGKLGSLGEKQEGPAVEIIGSDGQTIKLYNPKKVNFIKEGE